MSRTKTIILSEIEWCAVLLCISLSIMNCSTRWIDPDDLVGLDERHQRVIEMPSRVPLSVVWGGKIKKRRAPGYKFELLNGHLKQLPDGKSCWYDDKLVEFEIQHKQFQASKDIIGRDTLLLRLRKLENTKCGYKISTSINGKQSQAFYAKALGEGWYEIKAFIRAVNNPFDAYFPVKTKVSIQSEGEVCLTAVLLVEAGMWEGRPVSSH